MYTVNTAYKRTVSLVMVLMVMAIAFAGCASSQKKTKKPLTTKTGAAQNEVLSQTLKPVEELPQKKHDGSLWQEEGYLSDLFVNQKARRVGDIVTIKIVESSKATNNAATNTARDSSINAGLTSFFGLENQYTPTDKFFNPFGKVEAGFQSEFDGSGTTKRSGDLTAFISARVSEILPNGNFHVVGTREITVNNEKQIIVLSGIIRPRDISKDNVIQSTYISDAKIAYSGTGIINDRQKPGWLATIFEKIWPF